MPHAPHGTDAFGSTPMTLGRELLALTISRAIPVLGVLFLGWDARLVLFLLACEVLAAAVVLGWLFDYPRRSTLRAITLVILFAQVGFLMCFVLSIQERGVGYWALIGRALRETWFAVLLIFWNAAIACRQHMALARERDQAERFRANDLIGARWILHGFGPLFLFVVILVWFRTIDAWALAAVLGAKTLVDLGSVPVERRMTRGT